MSSLQQIVSAYNNFGLDADGVKEIELLQFAPSALETASEAVDAARKLVLVLVEPRLLAEIAGSSYSAGDLVQRLARFKRDLLREGRQARFLLMKVHGGPPRQDGKTLLAIREFLKAVRASFANFEGVVLVGAFPEAAVVRTWPWSGDVNGEQQYRVGLTPGEPRRFEIVLADLDGNWRELYHPSLDLRGYIFHLTPSTTVATVGSKVILGNPMIEEGQLSHLEDVFWIPDASCRIIPGAGGTTVELTMSCLNPEVSAADRLKPNPIARPDICVSRINARSVAVNPPSPRLLDAGGKPQAVPASPAIDFSMEAWPRSTALERRLLIDYFDRNHAFRAGRYAGHAFNVGIIEHNLGRAAADEGLVGLGQQVDYVPDANLAGATAWLKRPILLRAIAAHADTHSTFFREDPAAVATVEALAGGRPWRWIEQGGQYVPSFAGHHTGDLYLYRTLWENKQFANVPPGLMVHDGCDVNWVDHNELPYDDPCYGTFQNAESLLFYANQLAILCHVTWWNRGPFGFGEAFGASPSAVFGEAWKNVSEHIALDGALAQQTGERKQNYIWSVVGDWTLQKYYPAWPQGRKINRADATPAAVAAAGFGDKLHLFWKANGPDNRIYHSASSDGIQWPAGLVVNGGDATPEPPAACVFQSKLHLFWKANGPDNRIYHSASSDGIQWPAGLVVNGGDATPKAPAACVFGGKLYLFWKANGPDNRIYFSASSDGVHWPSGIVINGGDATPEAPAACVFQNKLYLVWKANGPDNRIYFSASSDGVHWPSGIVINGRDTTPKALTACVFHNMLYLFWKANDQGNRIYCAGSSDGLRWPNGHQINEFDTTPQGPASTVFRDRPYLFWCANDAGHSIYYGVNDAEHAI